MTKEEIEDLSLIDCASSEIELVHKAVNYIDKLQQENDILDTKIGKYIEQSDEWKELLNTYISQQREFVKYLEENIDEINFRTILAKYKEIIGGGNE